MSMPGRCHEGRCEEETEGKYLCATHARYHREYLAARRRELLAAKLCPRCGGKRGRGARAVLCKECRLEHAQYLAVRKEVLVEEGVCTRCGKRPAALLGGKTRPVRQGTLCDECRPYFKERSRAAAKNRSLHIWPATHETSE